MRVLGPTGRPLGFAFFSVAVGDPLRMVERGDTLSPTFLRDRLLAARAWREAIAPGVRGLPARARRGGRAALAGRGPLRRLPRRADAFAGHGALKAEIVAALVELFRPRGILERNDPRVRALEGLAQQVGVLHGEVPESGDRERERRALRGRPLARPEDGPLPGPAREPRHGPRATRGAACLDGFTYNGGFGLAGGGAGGRRSWPSTSPRKRWRACSATPRLNGIANVTAREANVFDFLHDLDGRGERFDTVILDPPAFAKSKSAVEKARRGYKEINLRALKLLRPGRVPRHLLLLVPRARGGPRSDPGRRRRGRAGDGQRGGEAPPGPRPSDPAGRAGDVLLEVLRPAEARLS